jgi:arylsulfatase A-like enzyme
MPLTARHRTESIGKLLAALDRLELADNTTVILRDDHSWNVGEHTRWCKYRGWGFQPPS